MHTPFLVAFAAAALACGLPSQELVLPAGGAWGAPAYNPTFPHPWGSSHSIWSFSSFRRQYLYDAVNFTASGVTGPVLITRLRFRIEDGSRDLGGHVWSNVTVQLAEAPPGITSATMSTTFAGNIGIGGVPVTFAALGETAAQGTVPNTYTIDIPLGAGSLLYDPGTGHSLVIDVNSPAAPVPATNLANYASVDNGATYSSQMLNGNTGGSGGALVVGNIPIVLLDYVGPGGKGAVVPASLASLGAGCGGRADSCYQFFDGGEAFDLQGTSLRLVPDNAAAPLQYSVLPGATPVDPSKAVGVVNVMDDSSTVLPLGYTFHFVGGTTTAIRAVTNGFVWLNGTSTNTDYSPTVVEFLGNGASSYPARLAPAWHDWDAGRNLASLPVSGMWVTNDTSGGPGNTVSYITWRGIGEYNQGALTGTSFNTFQCALFESSNEIEFRYGSIQSGSGILLTGFSRGSHGGGVDATDPGSRDLSGEGAFATNGPDGRPNMVLVQTGTGGPVAPGRAHLGNTIQCSVFGVPPSHVLGSFFTDFAVVAPGVPLPPFLEAGCNYNLVGTSSLYPLAFGSPLPNPTLSGTLLIPNNPAFCGAVLYTQFVSWGAAFPYRGDVSNVVAATIGSN